MFTFVTPSLLLLHGDEEIMSEEETIKLFGIYLKHFIEYLPLYYKVRVGVIFSVIIQFLS